MNTGKLDSTGPRMSPCLIPSTVSLLTAVLCGWWWRLYQRTLEPVPALWWSYVHGMSWSLVILAAPASDSVPSPVLISPHYAPRWTPDAKNAHEREWGVKMRQHWNIIILQQHCQPLNKQTNKTKHDKYFKESNSSAKCRSCEHSVVSHGPATRKLRIE